jgi:FMN phosphatase YigB (HAD superfamily)
VHIARWLTAADLRDHVQWIATSVELEFRKPDPEFFRRALSQSGVHATEALFVGNQLNTDILGGQQAGITTVYLSDPIYRSIDDADTPAAHPTHSIPTLFDLPALINALMTGPSELSGR